MEMEEGHSKPYFAEQNAATSTDLAGHEHGLYYEVRNGWIALYDYNTANTYYQNLKTKQTQWEKPSGWDTAYPDYWTCEQYASYYYGSAEEHIQNTDSVTESNVLEKFRQTSEDIVSKNEKYLSRPARRQVDPEEKRKIHWRPEGVGEYNIWYDRWVGEHWSSKDKGPAETRCEIKKDSGYTKATVYEPSGDKHYFCIHFARGACHLGSECGFLHLLPSDKDEKRMDLVHDVFGRERHRLHRDDMGGTGSIEKPCRSLYVGGLGNRSNTEDILWEEFREWGEIEEIRKISNKNIAFIRYKNRVNAEFAKVAMSDQKLKGREILNVRWAFDDPNPAAKKQTLRKAKIEMLQAADDLGLLDGPAVKRLCPYRKDYVTGDYPNTDHQYPDTDSPVVVGPMTKEQIQQVDAHKRAADDWNRLDEVFKKMENKSEDSVTHQSSSENYTEISENACTDDSEKGAQWNVQNQDPYRFQNSS